eukprot:958623-Amphidinium_carterae.1
MVRHSRQGRTDVCTLRFRDIISGEHHALLGVRIAMVLLYALHFPLCALLRSTDMVVHTVLWATAAADLPGHSVAQLGCLHNLLAQHSVQHVS